VKARRFPFEQSAEKGDRDAMFRLGVLCENGIGFARDFVRAAKMYQQAADLGSAEALHSLGRCFATGKAFPEMSFGRQNSFSKPQILVSHRRCSTSRYSVTADKAFSELCFALLSSISKQQNLESLVPFAILRPAARLVLVVCLATFFEPQSYFREQQILDTPVRSSVSANVTRMGTVLLGTFIMQQGSIKGPRISEI
jgi:hypothetical protein